MPAPIPIHRQDDNELLGFIAQVDGKWQALTIFGMPFGTTAQKEEAEELVRSNGLAVLTGVWEYYDQELSEWQPCIIKEANEHAVTVIETNFMGYQDSLNSKIITLQNPTTDVLKKL